MHTSIEWMNPVEWTVNIVIEKRELAFSAIPRRHSTVLFSAIPRCHSMVPFHGAIQCHSLVSLSAIPRCYSGPFHGGIQCHSTLPFHGGIGWPLNQEYWNTLASHCPADSENVRRYSWFVGRVKIMIILTIFLPIQIEWNVSLIV